MEYRKKIFGKKKDKSCKTKRREIKRIRKDRKKKREI
jgi:hypothetical protein